MYRGINGSQSPLYSLQLYLLMRRCASSSLLIGIFLFFQYIPLDCIGQEWQSELMMLGPRSEFGNVIVEDKLIIMGGIYNSRSGPNAVEVYDFQTNTWSNQGSMPTHRNHFTIGASIYQDEIWVCGGKLNGNGRNAVAQVDILNYKTFTWRQGPDLPKALWGAPTVVIENEIHILGGAEDKENTPTGLHFVLDLDQEEFGWKRAADLPIPRIHVAAVPYEGKIWVIGGEIHHNHTGDTRTVQVYDPATDTWDLSYPELPEARSHSEWATFVYGDKIYSVSGIDHSQNPKGQKSIYAYTSPRGSWDRLFDLPEQFAAIGAKAYNNRLYVYGGGVGDYFKGGQNNMYSHPLEPDSLAPSFDTTTVHIQHIFLEGFHDSVSQTQSTILREKGLLPVTQPFENSIWNYQGDETLNEIPQDMSDWILVSLADTLGMLLVSKACILTQDGVVKEVSGSPKIAFPSLAGPTDSLANQTFLVILQHKGHLPIVFKSRHDMLIDPANGSISLGIEQMKEIGNQKVLYSGDFDGNGIINNQDFNLWKLNSAAINTYLPIDSDGNGIINNQDFNFWIRNGSKIGNPIIVR